MYNINIERGICIKYPSIVYNFIAVRLHDAKWKQEQREMNTITVTYGEDSE